MQKSNFLELVAKERTRQIVENGYTAEHDDDHVGGEIADAGACYANSNGSIYRFSHANSKHFPIINVWPWDFQYFKKEEHDRKQQLIIAAAFINAEYDRIVRAEQKQNGETHEIPQH